MNKPFAIVTGASSGIGLELAAICAQEGFDLLVAADRPEIQAAADRFRALGADVAVVETDLATTDSSPGPIKPSTTAPRPSSIRSRLRCVPS
jgi:NAD(P)-dependent dehydrogenase (short-subunit alcohol dehydrogenase family)